MRVIDNDDIRRLRQFIVHAMLDVDCTNPKVRTELLHDIWCIKFIKSVC